jgi:hypothetical protein
LINFVKFQLCGLITLDPIGGKIQNFTGKSIRDLVKQIKKYGYRVKKPFVFAILSGKVKIFRREQRKIPFSNSRKNEIFGKNKLYRCEED